MRRIHFKHMMFNICDEIFKHMILYMILYNLNIPCLKFFDESFIIQNNLWNVVDRDSLI